MTETPKPSLDPALRECEITALAIKLCHYRSPANPVSSCCQYEPDCIKEARRRLNQPPRLQE